MPYLSRSPFRKALVAALILIGLGAPLTAFASNKGSASISGIAYAQDRRDEYSLGRLLALPGDWGWVSLAKPSLAMGFISHPLWLRISAENTENEDGMVLFLSGPYMERVEAYVVPRPAGEEPAPPEAREMRYGISGYRLDFSLPPGGKADIYIRLKSEGPIAFSASIRGTEKSEALENGIAISLGTLLGCLAASCCMAFIILGLGRRANLGRIGLYALYLLCAAVFAALANGVAFLMPWAGKGFWAGRSGPMAACALALLACAISKSAIAPGARKTPLVRLLTVSQALCLPALAALAFLPMRAALVCCGLYFFFSYAVAVSACVLGSLKRDKGAPLLLAAFLCFILGLILGPFRIVGLLGLSPFPDTIPGYLGIIAQAILIVTLMVQETSGGASGDLGRTASGAEAGGGGGAEPRKRDFFSMAVHGLKTPLSLVTAPLESLRRGEYGDSVPLDHKSFGIMHSGLRSMERIVDGILDVIGAEAERREPEREALDLPARVRLYSSEFNSAFQSRGVGLSLEAGDGIWGLCDKRDFEVIVFNLISAAMGRSRSGDKVSIRLTSGAGLAALDVADSGPIVTSDERAALFDPYRPRGESTFPGLFEGGIGIYQAHAVARQNGGDLTALDSGGKPGLTLRITLPLADPAEAGAAAAEAKADPGLSAYRAKATTAETPQPGGGSDSMKRILVVEDSADLLEFLEDSLSREYRVDLAANGLEALNIMKAGRIPDLIISDVMMPVMDGPALLKQLKQNERLASIPLIFLTARNQPSERVQSIVDGAVAYIAKPFFFEELQAAIDNILKLKASGIKEVERRLLNALHAKPDEGSFHQGESFEAKADTFGFSKQEREVASLLITGKSDKEIAAALSLSPRTVSNYMGKMLKKAQVSSRTELATRLAD